MPYYLDFHNLSNREKCYLPIFWASVLLTDSQRKASLISNLSSKTSIKQGDLISNSAIDFLPTNNADFYNKGIPPNIGFLYIITEEGSNISKIGITKDIKSRISSMQVGNPRKLEVSFCSKMFHHKHIENSLKYIFINENIRGEWFDLDGDKLDNLIERLKSLPHNIIL